METKRNAQRWLWLSVGLLLVVAVAVTACAAGVAPAAAGGGAASTDDATQNVISVSGEGQAFGAPDVAFVELGIDVSANDIGQAVSQANQTMTSVRDAVSGQGIEDRDMQTVNFNVWVEEPRDEQGLPTGQRIYHVTNMLRVKVRDIATVGDVIGAGLDAGANTVGGLSFGIDDPSSLQADARVAAVEDAQARAQQLADALGVKLGPPVRVSESMGGVPVIERAAVAEAFGMGGGAPPVSEGQLAVNVMVNVEFLIEQ